MSNKISHRSPRGQNHAAPTARTSSRKRRNEAAPSTAPVFEASRRVTTFAKDVGDTAQRLAKSARVFSHTVYTQIGRPETNLIQVIEDGLSNAARAFAPKPDFMLLADEAEDYLGTIRHAAETNSKLRPYALEAAAQYQGILTAGLVSAVWDYQHDPDSRAPAQRQAMDFADALYRENPTEDSLEGLFATYAAVDRDVARMRQATARNETFIRNHIPKAFAGVTNPLLDDANRGLSLSGGPLPPPVSGTEGPAGIFLQAATEDHSHIFAKAHNAVLMPLLAATETRITSLVQSSQTQSPFYRAAHLGIAHTRMGNTTIGVRHLEEARMIFRDKGEAKPPASELATQIELLHRIAENVPEDPQRARDRLSEADSMIELLAGDKDNSDKATLLHIDNMLRMLPHRLQEHEDILQHNPDKAEDYHRAVAWEHQKIITDCARVKSKDPAVVASAHGHGMLQAAVQFEKNLDAAISLRLTGDVKEARRAHLDAEANFTKTRSGFEHTTNPAFMQEAMGRMHWANATYTFKTGDVEQSLRDLRTLSDTYGASGAAQILREGSDEVWVRHYGIVDEHGNFSMDIGKPSQVAKWKKIADKLLDDKASATKAMMAGAGVAVVGAATLDTVFGTHVIGGEALLTMGQAGMIGAGVGLVTERGYQVLSAQHEISSAYKTGIANVTTEELAERGKALAGEVAVCFLAGGAARYLRMGVMQLGAGLRAPLLRGLLVEAGHVAEGVGFHEFAGMIHGTSDHSAMGYLRSILTLRMLGASNEVNFGAMVFPGEAFADAVMRHGVNSALANIPLQTFESAIVGNLSGFGQGYFDSLFALYAISVGNKVPETLLRAPQILVQAKAKHQVKIAQKLIIQMEQQAKAEASLQSDIRYAETPQDRAALTQKLVEAMRGRASALQGLARRGLVPADNARAYAEGVETFAKVMAAARQQNKFSPESSPLRRMLAQTLLLPVAPFIGTMGSGGGGPTKEQSTLVTELSRGKPELRDWKPGDTVPSLDQLVRNSEDVTLLIALGEHRTDVWALLRTLSDENPAVFTSEHRQTLEAISHKDPAVESTLDSLARRRLDLFSRMTANSVAQLSSTDCARHAAELRLRLNVGKIWEQNTALGEYTLLITHGHLSADAYRHEAAALITDAAKLAIDSLGRHQAAFEMVVSQGGLTHADMNALVESDRFSLPAEWPQLEGKAQKRYKSNLKWWITHYGRPLKVFRNGAALPALLMNVGGTPRQIYKLLAETPYDTDMPFEFQSRDGHTLATQTAQKVFNLNRGGKNLGLEIHISLPELLEFARTHPDSIDPTTNYISIRGAALPEFQKFVREHTIPVRILIPMELSSIHLPILARHPNIHIQYLSARNQTLTPDAQAAQWASEAAIPSRRADVQALNIRLFTEGGDDAFAAAGARNNFDNGMIFFSPYSPALFFLDAEVDPGTGAIRALKARSTKKLSHPGPATIDASVAIFSPWASANLDELHSTAMKLGLRDRDPVPAWILTEIGQIVETHTEMSIEGTRITTPFAKWFSVINSSTLTLGEVFSDRIMDVYGKNLPPKIETDLQGALIGKPFRTRRGSPIPIPSKGSADTHGAAPPLSVHSSESSPRLGIVGVGKTTEYPPLTQGQRLPWEADSITTQEFHDAIVDHFHPMHFNDTPLQHRRQGIIDRWAMHEYEIEFDTVTPARTPVLRATDAFLARTRSRSEAFVALLDLRVEAQLRNKFGAHPHLTDMDIEAERNRILAEILSAGLGTYLPIARGKISVSTADGVIVLRPSRAEDYAAIDQAIQSGDNPGEVLTGGFYCHKSALRLPFIVINPAMGDHAFSIFRHEIQHLRKHASNRFEPHFTMPTPDAVPSYPEALRQHFGINAKDEILAYLEGATPPRDTVAALTKPGGIYDAIAKARDKIQLSDDDIATLTQEHNTYVAHQVWATNEAIVDLVSTGWHPEAARRALINSLSGVPFMNWEMQLPMAVSALLAAPPQRQAPPPAERDAQRAELRVWLETEILPNRSKGWKKMDARAQKQTDELSSIAQELRGTVRVERLQELRRHVEDGNSELEQLAEVLQFMTDECRGQLQVVQRRNAADSKEAKTNAAQWRKLTKKLEHLVLLSGLRLTRYLRASNLAKVQDRLDRLLLLQTAHSQQLLSESAEKTLEAQTPSIARPRIRETDVARMRVEDQLSHIYKLRNAMAQATAPDEVVRAASLYATYVRHGLLTRQMRAFEFEALMDIAQTHPDWMPHLKYAFLGISGTMMPEQWQHILQGAMPVQPAEATPKTTLSIGNKTRALHTIEGYRQQLETSPHVNSHISKAIDALELALRRGEPIPQVVVRYGMLTPDMINHAILNGASKENMARYFIVKEGQRPPTSNETWLTVMEVTVPLDRFVRFLMKSTLPLDIDDTHIITTERTNAAFNHFLMHSFVRRHVAIQDGLLTPELVFHARRGVISLEVRAASEAQAAPPSRQSIHGMNAIGGGEQRVADLAQKPWDSAIAQVRKHFGENLATRANDHRSEIDDFLTQMGITPSALELETFLGGGGLDIRLDQLTPYTDQLKLLPQSLLTQLFTHQLLHPQMLRTLETSGTISRHGFEPTLRLLATLATGTPADKERQLQAMGYSAEGAREIVSTIVHHLPFGIVDILSLILPHSEVNGIAALRMAIDSTGNFSRHSLRQASIILKDSAQAGIPLSPDELSYMTRIQATSRTDMVVTNSLNAVDRMMTMESMHFRYELLRRLYGDTHAIPEHNQAAVATVPLNDRYTLKLETGIYESACGMQVTLYERDPVQGELELGSIGFQESSTGIEVVGYQGADLGKSQRTDSATQFRAFSGGVDPMPWLAVLTGQTLLTQASTQGKTLRWISGERIKMGYPHLKGMSPPHITSVQDARGPWDGHPQHAAIMAEYDALTAATPKTPSDVARRDQRLKKIEDYVKVFRAGERHTAKLVDATAQNLGFRRKGNDAAWHRYTKDPAEFGSAILNSRDVDRERVQASLQATHAAIRADEKFNLWATSPQRPPKRIFPAQSADKVTLEDFMGILSRDFGDEYFPHEDLLLARNKIGDRLIETEDRMDQLYEAARAKTKDPVARQRLATDQFLVRTRARTDVFLRLLELRVQSKLRSQFGEDAAITELDQEAALSPIIVEILNEAFSGPPMPALKGHIDITDRDGVLVLRPAHPDDFAALRNIIANRMDTNQNLPFGFFNANSALGIPVLVISPECSEEAWVILRHEFDHFLKFASNRFERGAFPPLADNLMSDGKLNPAAQTRYMNGMRDYLFKIAKDETLAHLTNVRAPRDVLADLTRVGGQYDFIAIVKAELAERIASGVGGTTVSVGHQDPMTAQDYALSRIDTMRARHDQGITKNIWLLYDAVETLVDHGYHPETARLTLIHALTPVPYTQWPTQLPKIVAQLSGQPARTLLPESLDPQDHHFRLRRWIERDNPALAEVKALIDDHTAAIEKTQGELAQPASAARLQQLRQEWRHQISEPQQLLEVLHLMLGELECRREVMQRRGNNLPEVIRLTAKIDRFKLLIDTAKTQGQLTAMKLLKLQTTIDKQLRGHSAHVQTKIQGGTVRNSMSAMGALAMADLGVGLHQAWLSVADTVATHPYALTAAAAAIVGATLFASRFTESGRLRNVIKTLGIKDLIKARAAHPEDPILSLNAFLRGELGREPTLAEVRTFEQHTWEYRERAAIYGREVPGEFQILQIYNKEFVDALAARITATAQEFRRKQGRDPVIVEIAAGDGRLSRALQRRGIMITATDAHEWHSGGSNDVETHVPWAMAMRRADIILGSWLPAAQDRGPDDFDVPIAQHLIEHPDKTFIQIEAACTNTKRFKDFVSAEQQKGALFIDEPPEFAELLTSRLGNNTPLDPEDELTALLVPRMDNRTHLRIYRGTEERLPAFLGIPSVLPAHGGRSQIHYSGAPFIADLAKQAVAGVLNFFGVGHPTATPLPVKPSDKPAAAVPAYIPPHWKDLMPGKLDFGHPIWLQHVDSALADAGSYQNAYRHMMHNAFATRWDAHHSPTKFNFDTDPWTNSRFLTALRAVRHRMAAELAANHFVGIDTADHQMSRYTFKSLGEFDAFVVTELQRIRDSEIPPARPAPELDPRNARIFSVRDILSELGKMAPLLHIEGVSIPREFKEGDRVEIGRDGSNNDISFPTDDLVSRAHAVIVFERRGEFIGRVTDLLSANATKVIRDGVTTTLRDGEQFKLKVGDCVQVGSQRIYVGEPPPRSKPGEDPAPTSVVPIRFREHEAQWREEYHPRTRDMDHIWRVRKNEEGGRQRLVDIFRANALRDPSQRRWPINFVVQAKPGAPDDSLVRVGQRFWPGQTVPEAGVKHIQIANGEYAQWAGELRGIFDAQGQLVEVQFNASSGEFGQQSLNASQDEDIRIVRHLLAKILHIEATRVRFVR